MAWQELTSPKDTFEEQASDFALPVPQDPEFGQLQQSLFEEVKQSIQSDPDPRFARLRFGPGQQEMAGGEAGVAPPAPAEWQELEPPPPAPKEGDYGWGISNALMRGFIRAGQFIDLAQEDWEEYAQGEKALEKYGLSKEDQAKMEEMQEAEGLWEVLGNYVKNPRLAAQVTVESLPMSAASLVGGAVGGVAAGPAGAAIGAGTGSFITEYLASLSEAFAENRIDATDPNALKAAYADEKIMAEARDIAAKRGLGIAAFDALSMGLAGRIYKPVTKLTGAAQEGASLTRRAAGKTLGGTSEMLAQSAAGGAGELSGQMLAGQEYDPFAVGSEMVGELLPGLGEIAIGAAIRPSEQATTEPTDDLGMIPPGALPTPPSGPTTPTAPTETTEGVLPESIAQEAESYEVPTDGTSEAEKAAIGEALSEQDAAEQSQGQLDLGVPPSPAPETPAPATPTSAPESEQATTPTQTPEQTAPVTPVAEPIAEDEVVTADDLVTQPTPTEEAPAEEAPTVETPMIEAKEVEEGFKALTKKTKGSLPGIRKALKALGQSIQSRYPDSKLPALQKTFGAKRIGEFFKTLDEEVIIDEDLPNLKEFLRAVVDSPDAATAIQNINRLTDYVNSSQQVLPGAEVGGVLGQVNEQVSRYDAFERERKSRVNKKTKKPTQRKGFRLADRAMQLDELATAVEALGKRANELGVTDVDAEGLEALIRRARTYREDVATAKKRILKGGTGSPVTPYKFRDANLNEVGGKLREMATTLAEAVAKAEKTAPKTQALPETKKGKAKVETKKPVTEAPAKPKKGEAAKKVSKARSEKKVAPEKPATKKPPKYQDTADWLREFVNVGGTRGVTESNLIAIEKNLQLLEESGHPEAQLLRKQLEATNLKGWKGGKTTSMVPGTKVAIKPDAGNWRVVAIPLKGKVQDISAGQNFISFHKTKAEAEQHAKGLEKDLKGEVVVEVKKVSEPAFLRKGEAKEIVAEYQKKKTEREAKAGELAQQAEQQREIDETRAADEAYDKLPPTQQTIEDNLNELVEQAEIVEKSGGIETYDGGSAAYYLATLLLSGNLTRTDLTNLGQPKLRKIAKALTAKPAVSKKETIARILAAAKKEVTRVDAELAAMEEEGKPKPKIKAKPKKKVANPDEVIEVVPKPTTGKQSLTIAEEMGFPSGTTLTEALAESGISKEHANIVRGLLETVSKAKRDKIRTALLNYDGTPEADIKFIATLSEVMGGQIADSDMMAILGFARGNYENRVQLSREEPSGREDYLAGVAEEADMSVEDVEFLESELGYGGSALFPDQGEEGPVTDAFSEDVYKDLNFIETSDVAPVIKGNIESGRELYEALLGKGMKLLGFLEENMNSAEEIEAGKQRKDLKVVQVRELLDIIIEVMPTNNRYYQLAKRLRELNSKIPIYLQDAPIAIGREDLASNEQQTSRTMGVWNDGRSKGGYEFGYIRLSFDQTANNNDPRQFFHHALHEIIHAATTVAYDTNPEFRSEIDSLLDQTLDFMEQEYPNYKQELAENSAAQNTFYGITNGKEFIAEALTNERFQKYLSKIPSINPRRRSVTNMLREFYDAIKRFLGYSVRNTVLDDVLTLVDANLYTDAQNINASRKKSWLNRRSRREANAILDRPAPSKPKPTRVRARERILDSERQTKKGINATAKGVKEALKNAGRKANLAFSNRDVIERNYRKIFDRLATAMGMDANPVTTYTKAKNSASQLVRKFERKAYLYLKKFQAVTNTERAQIQAQMADITKANIDPTKSLRDPANDHIWTKPNKKGVRKIRKRYKEIAPKARANFVAFQKSNPEAAALVEEMAALTKEIHETKISAALRALGEAFGIDAKEIATLENARTFEEIEKLFPEEVLEQAQYDKENNLFAKGKTDTEGKKLLKEQLKEAEARAEVAKSAKTILKESSIKGWYFPLRRYGEYVVSTGKEVTDRDEKYVSFHSTQAEAEAVARKLNGSAEEGQEVYVSRKISAGATAKDVAVVFKELKSRIKDDATRNRMKAALSEIMAANAAYASQLKRADVDGVAADDMARAFEEYVHVSKYTIGDLMTAHKVSESLNQLREMEKGAGEAGIVGDDINVIGDVIGEINKQNKAETEDREMSGVQKAVGLIGFLNFLGAPSYWALNATQTYTVTLPYIASRFGIKGTTKLASAQKQVLAAVAAALNSNDKSYEGFISQLPPAAQKVVEALENENVIQSTIAHEFGDILSPSYWQRMLKAMPPVAKTANLAMQVMEKVPEAVEHYNRISTALAIYELSGGDLQATIDGVQATQFNYDTANRARLLKKLPIPLDQGGRGIVTPIMMFKTYGIGIMRLLYGSMIDSIKGETKQERAQARKLAAGLMVSHTLFGGVAGGIMLGPIQAIQAAINMALEPDDEWDVEQATEEFMAEIAGDFAATAVRRGIPAAVFNVDMSNSINLGNLIWMSNDRLDVKEYGNIEQVIFKGLGPVAQYGVTAYREGARFFTGDTRGSLAEFAEAAIPLKAYRGVSQAIRYSFGEGIATDAGLQMVKPEDFDSMLVSALGFQPTQKTEIMSAYYDDQLLDQKRSKRKSQLIRRANNAIMSNDQQAVSAIFDDIISYNLSVPEPQYRITPGDMAKLRSRQRTQQREFDRDYVYPNQ